ncbi:homeobox protein 13-like [Harmonia axyridis]|uniref:homeobox protein 13-like n=1 Tax=Harmonia axyridis TaxID=115357 RepID=UPI001E276A2D|nr:homeobox protein 13-like [Harmonia axyridis]
MAEEGLEALHNVIKNISIQDEKIWRQTAAKKCLKTEIERIEEQTRRYEIQIATFEKDPLYKKREEVARLLEENMKEHLQTHKLLSLAIIAKKEEVERKTKEIESWDKKYKEVNVDFKEAFDLKKNFYESTNPTYKKLMEIETAQRIAEVELKRLKSVFERRQKSKKLLEQIQEKIFHKTIVNFISAILRKKKYVEITCKTKILEEQKKKMVRNMFEAQEALKKLRVRHTQISSGMFTRKVPILNLQEITKRNEVRNMPDINKLNKDNISQMNNVQLNKSKKQNPQKEDLSKEKIPSTPKKSSTQSSNRLNIISNKLITLPPLKSIFKRQRCRLDTTNSSFGDISFSRSQNSQTDQANKPKPSPKCSQEEKTRPNIVQNIQGTSTENNSNTEISAINIGSLTKPSDCLKNLKFSTKTHKFQTPKKIQSTLSSESNQTNSVQKASILKGKLCKRKLNDSLQDIDLDSSQRKREKNVIFANPIQQQIQINQNSTITNEVNLNQSSLIETSSRVDTNQFLDGNLSMMSSTNNDEFQIEGMQFSFEQSVNSNLGKKAETNSKMTPGKNN